MTLDDFLQAIIADPHSAATTWAVMADWLEEQGDPRWEFVRLMHQREYRSDMPPEERDGRVRQLLASGMQPIAPSIINSIGMRLVLIPAGTFLMGSPDGKGRRDEHPQHEVEITRPFFMGAYPVTQEQYQRVMGNNPSWFSPAGGGKEKIEGMDTKLFPVESITWDDANAFCDVLSKLTEEQTTGRVCCLPTESEWEYACRGGATSYSRFSFGAKLSSEQANVRLGELARLTPVGCHPANGFGLFDMHGNVWEWCLDWYDENYYKNSPSRDAKAPVQASKRVLRGGSFYVDSASARSAARHSDDPTRQVPLYGFRVACHLD